MSIFMASIILKMKLGSVIQFFPPLSSLEFNILIFRIFGFCLGGSYIHNIYIYMYFTVFLIILLND